MTRVYPRSVGVFQCPGRREIVAEFSGRTLSSDAGGLLLQGTDAKMNLLYRFSPCFFDGRNPILIEHSVEQMIRQRVYALAPGYEHLNDHDQLRHNPSLGLMAGKADPGAEPLAGKSTLNRMELGAGMPSRYKKISFWRDGVDELLVDVFLEEIVLDIDTTDLALHGNQEGRFYHGHYRAAAAQQHRTGGGEQEGSGAHRPADRAAPAGSTDRSARRFGIRCGRTDDVVRAEPSWLCIGNDPQSEIGKPDNLVDRVQPAERCDRLSDNGLFIARWNDYTDGFGCSRQRGLGRSFDLPETSASREEIDPGAQRGQGGEFHIKP